jgi:hypothetical protein
MGARTPLPDCLAFRSKALDLETLEQINIMQANFFKVHLHPQQFLNDL